jgi:hypothetical protein
MDLILVLVVVVMVFLSPVFLGIGFLWVVNSRRARKMDPAARARWQAEVDARKARLNRQRIVNQNNPYSGWYQGR